MYEYGEPWWNDIDRGNLKNLEKTLLHFHLKIHYFVWKKIMALHCVVCFLLISYANIRI
jgi:hypothetical protein